MAAPHSIIPSRTGSGGNRGGLADDGEREHTDKIGGVLGFNAKAEMAEEVHGNANVGAGKANAAKTKAGFRFSF